MNYNKKRRKEIVRERMQDLWWTNFEAWADIQRRNCEKMVEDSREKWNLVHKFKVDEQNKNMDDEFMAIVGNNRSN